MRIEVNGESQEVPDGSSLADLVRKLALQPTRIAVELNRNVARRADWATTILADGDRIEIVHFVGGGSVMLCHFGARQVTDLPADTLLSA